MSVSFGKSAIAGRTLGTLLSAIALLAGCGGESIQEIPKPQGTPVPAKGKVLLPGGKPLEDGTVIFVPVKEPGLSSSGKTQSDGTFSLKTSDERDGAFPGEYTVRVLPPPVPAGTKHPKYPFPTGYASEDSSALSATVKASGNEDFVFQLQNTIPHAASHGGRRRD